MSLKHLICTTAIVSIILMLSACKENTSTTGTPAAPTTASTPAMTPAASNAGHDHPAFPLIGKVAEIHNGAGYSYILLDSGTSQNWVATSQVEVKVGDEIGFADGNVMHDFPSKALNRTFSEIIFSSQIMNNADSGHAAAPAAQPADSFAAALQGEHAPNNSMPVATPAAEQGSGKATMPAIDVKVDKATGENAYTVGELFAKAAELNGKTVLVQAQVMKFSPMIMGKNWLHVQDGTGSSSENTHDLVVTTMATVENGATVLIEATLKTNQDFGYGYLYNVILEDATIK